jgi:hypothetical protein
MKIFGREPTVVLQAVSVTLSVVVAFGVPGLSAEQAALIIGAGSAAIGVANAVAVRPVAPSAFVAAITAGSALLAAYGLGLPQEAVGSISAAVPAVLALFVRGQVTPVTDPRPAEQVVG